MLREPHLVIRDFRRHAAAMGEWKPEEWARWRGLFSEQQQSGQSIAGFCRDRALPVWQFYEWRKRLRAKIGEGYLRHLDNGPIGSHKMALEPKVFEGLNPLGIR